MQSALLPRPADLEAKEEGNSSSHTLPPKASLLLCHSNDTEDGLCPCHYLEEDCLILTPSFLEVLPLWRRVFGPWRQSSQVLNFTSIPILQ